MGERKTVYTDKAPEPVGPYSQAVKIGDLLFVSGQLPIDTKTGALITDSVSAMARAALSNISEISKAAGSEIGKCVKINVFLTDIEDFNEVNEVFKEFFSGDPPARALVAVAALPRGARIEIEAVVAL